MKIQMGRVKLSLWQLLAALTVAVLLSAPVAFAQFGFPTRRIISGANLPAACTSNSSVKDIWYKTGASAGLYVCTAANTWSGPVGAASGDVVGPASAADGGVPVFGDTTGKLLEDSGLSITAGALAFPFGGFSFVENIGFQTSIGVFNHIQDISSLSDPRTVTWPDAAGTVTLGGNTFTGTGSVVRATAPAIGTAVLTLPRATDTLFAALGTPADGTYTYCSDCTKATPCASGGGGAFAKRIAGAWDCD